MGGAYLNLLLTDYPQAAHWMIPSKVMAKLATAGLSEEQADLVASMLSDVEEATAEAVRAEADAALEERHVKARARWHRWDEKRRSNVGKRLPTPANVSGPLADAEDRTSNLEIEPPQKVSRANGDVGAFRTRLAPLVSAEVLEEFIKVRRKKRGALTGFAAGLFIADAERVSMTPQAAATECVRSSWITVKPEYFRGTPRAGPPAKPNPVLDAANALMEKLDAVPPSETQANPTYPRLVAFAGG